VDGTEGAGHIDGLGELVIHSSLGQPPLPPRSTLPWLTPQAAQAAQSSWDQQLRIQAGGDGFGDFSSLGGNTQQIPLQYVDPLFDPILMVFPQDNIRELNRRLRHYYKYDPHIRPTIDFHTETPISDFDLVCPANAEVQEYFNDFKDRVNLLDHIINICRDYWLLGEGFLYGNWDEHEMEFSGFVQLPPEEVEVKSAYILPQRVYVLRPNKELQRLQMSSNPSDQQLNELMSQHSPLYADALRQGRPFVLDSNRLIVLQRSMAGYSNRGISPVMAALKDLLYQDYLILYRMVFIQRHASPLKIFKLGCFSDDTDLLTIDGFKNVTELTDDDMFATLNPETEQIEYHRATKMHVYDYEGDMVHFKTQHCDLMVTPNHRMWTKHYGTAPLYRGKKKNDWHFREAKDVKTGHAFRSTAQWTGVISTDSIRVGEHDIAMDDFLQLAGFFVSEGSTTLKQDGSAWFTIHQSQQSTVFNDQMSALIKRMDIPFRRYERATTNPALTAVETKMYAYTLCRKAFVEYFRAQFGEKSFTKKVPAWIKMLPPRELKIFLEAAILGDGSDSVEHGVRRLKYHTSSRQLADDIQEISLKLGYASTVMLRPMARLYKHQAYLININIPDGRKRLMGRTPHIYSKSCIRSVPYKGKVYCPTVPPHHLVFARRNGRVVVTGQSAEKGFIPPPRWYSDFRRLLAQAANDPNFNIVTHPLVQTEIVTGHDKILPLEKQFDEVRKRIFAALFVSDAIISGEKTPFASGITFMKGLMHRYLTFRNNLTNELKRKVFANISRMREFYTPSEADVNHRVRTSKNRRLIVPDVYWQKANLLSNQAIMQMLLTLREKKEVPMKYVAEMFGFNYDDMMHQLKAEMGTVSDPLWQELRKKAVTDPKFKLHELGRRVLLGEDVVTALKEQEKDKIKTDSEAAQEKERGKEAGEEFPVPHVPSPGGHLESEAPRRPIEIPTETPQPAALGELPEGRPKPAESGGAEAAPAVGAGGPGG
jgi:hypothetical protein